MEKTYQLVAARQYSVVNLDTMICLEKPRIMPFVSSMRVIISQFLKITPDEISIKATTTEKLGFIGREEGIMAQAVVLLTKVD